MATVEKNTLLCGRVGEDLTILYPATRLEMVDGLPEALEEKSEKANISSMVLSAGEWSQGTYSLETQYPALQYDIEVSAGDMTVEQFDAFGNAKIIGSSKSNVLRALGDVPTMDLPVIIKVVKK